jgi:hypothetical protein
VAAFQIGLREGKHVGEQLRSHPMTNLHRTLSATGAFLVGVMVPLIAGGALVDEMPPLYWVIGACAGALVGLRMGPTVRKPLVLGLVLFCAVSLLAGLAE